MTVIRQILDDWNKKTTGKRSIFTAPPVYTPLGFGPRLATLWR